MARSLSLVRRKLFQPFNYTQPERLSNIIFFILAIEKRISSSALVDDTPAAEKESKKLGPKLNVVVWCESVELKKAAVQAGLGVYSGSAEAGLRERYLKVIQVPR
jgi:hypothetical protein